MQSLPVIEDSIAKDNVKLSILHSCAGGAVCFGRVQKNTHCSNMLTFLSLTTKQNRQKTQTQTQQSVKEKYLCCLRSVSSGGRGMLMAVDL